MGNSVVIEDVANFNETGGRVGNFSIAIRVGSIGRECFRFSLEVPHTCGFLRRGVGDILDRGVSHNGIRISIVISSLGRGSAIIRVGHRCTSTCVGTLASLSGRCGVGGSLGISALTGGDRVFGMEHITTASSIVRTTVVPILSRTVSDFVGVHSMRNRELVGSIASHASFVLSGIRFIRDHSPRAIDTCGRGVARGVGRVLGSGAISRDHVLARITVFTSGITIDRRAIHLHDRVGRFHSLLSSDRPMNQGLSFVMRRVGHRTGAVNSGTRSVRVTRAIISVGSRVRGVHRRVRGVRWIM